MNKAGHEPIKNLFEDLRDGHKLLALLEVLTNQKYVSFCVRGLVLGKNKAASQFSLKLCLLTVFCDKKTALSSQAPTSERPPRND